MKVGITLGQDVTPTLAAMVEQLGFDSVWSGDRVWPLNGRRVQDGLVTAAAMVGATSRIRVGTCVYLLPLRSAPGVAKAVTTLADLSDGRFEFGVGIGGWEHEQYEMAGVPFAGRSARMDEAIRLIRLAATGQPFRFDGRFTSFRTGQFIPTGPVPILIGGTSRAARRRAALLGDGYMPYLTAPEFLERARSEIGQIAAQAGRDLTGFRYIAHLYVCPRNTYDASESDATECMAQRYGDAVRGRVERYAVVGTHEQCRESVQRFAELGVSEVVLGPICNVSALPEEITRLAKLFL